MDDGELLSPGKVERERERETREGGRDELRLRYCRINRLDCAPISEVDYVSDLIDLFFGKFVV